LREERRLRLFDYRVLKKIFGIKRDEVRGEWRLDTEEFNDLYSSPNITRVITKGKMGWAGHVAHGGKGEVHTGFWWDKLKDRDHLGDQGVEGRVILKWIFRKWDERTMS